MKDKINNNKIIINCTRWNCRDGGVLLCKVSQGRYYMFRYCLKFDGPLIPGTLIVYVQEMGYL